MIHHRFPILGELPTGSVHSIVLLCLGVAMIRVSKGFLWRGNSKDKSSRWHNTSVMPYQIPSKLTVCRGIHSHLLHRWIPLTKGEWFRKHFYIMPQRVWGTNYDQWSLNYIKPWYSPVDIQYTERTRKWVFNLHFCGWSNIPTPK